MTNIYEIIESYIKDGSQYTVRRHKTSKRWYKDDKLHRDEKDPNAPHLTLPAIIKDNGDMWWYIDGKLHRNDKDPTTGLTLYSCIKGGNMQWYTESKIHRDEKDPNAPHLTLPAIIKRNGDMWWYKDDKVHRDDKDPVTGETLPAVIGVDGSKEWYNDNKCHRDDKDPNAPHLTLPAIIYANGDKSWWKDDKRHRDDKDPVTGETLPAVIYNEGEYKEWWENGKRVPNPTYINNIRSSFKKYSEISTEGLCYNSISYITLEDLSEIDDKDILLLPVYSVEKTKYHCYTREEIELWWKRRPKNTHPTTRVTLTLIERQMIQTFMDDQLFFQS